MNRNRLLFTTVALALLAIAVMTIRAALVTSTNVLTAATVSPSSAKPPEVENSARGADPAGYWNTVSSASLGMVRDAARPPELYSPQVPDPAGYWSMVSFQANSADGNSTAVSVGPVRENITERGFELQRARSCCWFGTVRGENIAERSFELLDQLAQLRAATAQFHQTEAAYAAGYTLVPGLDYCFNNPGVGGMGVHLIKTSSLDLTVDTLQPEAMVYQPGPKGQLQLVAVEYIVPAAAWDAAGNTQPPSVLGQSFHLNSGLGVYILHAWIWRENPSGMFQDWNPKVACP